MRILRKNEVARTRRLIGRVDEWNGGWCAVKNRMFLVHFSAGR